MNHYAQRDTILKKKKSVVFVMVMVVVVVLVVVSARPGRVWLPTAAGESCDSRLQGGFQK